MNLLKFINTNEAFLLLKHNIFDLSVQVVYYYLIVILFFKLLSRIWIKCDFRFTLYETNSRVILSVYVWKCYLMILSNDLHLFLCSQIVNIFNLFITYGDTFLPSPGSYDELYYEIIRVHQIFDNLYSLGMLLFLFLYTFFLYRKIFHESLIWIWFWFSFRFSLYFK